MAILHITHFTNVLLVHAAIVFGGGAVFNKQNKELMDASDPAQLAALAGKK